MPAGPLVYAACVPCTLCQQWRWRDMQSLQASNTWALQAILQLIRQSSASVDLYWQAVKNGWHCHTGRSAQRLAFQQSWLSVRALPGSHSAQLAMNPQAVPCWYLVVSALAFPHILPVWARADRL